MEHGYVTLLLRMSIRLMAPDNRQPVAITASVKSQRVLVRNDYCVQRSNMTIRSVFIICEVTSNSSFIPSAHLYPSIPAKLRNQSYFTTQSTSVSLSWYRAPLWDLRPDITSWRDVTVWNLQTSKLLYDWQSVTMSWYRIPLWDLRPDITSWRDVTVWNLQRSKLLYDSESVSNYVLVSSTLVVLANRYYFLSECYCLKLAKVKVTLRMKACQSVCLGIEHPCGTCDQILLPVRIASSSKLLYDWQSVSTSWYRAPLWEFPVRIARSSKLLYDWWWVSQYVLVSSTLVGLATRYYFLSECYCLKLAKVKVTLRMKVCQSVSLGIEHPCGTCDHILLPVRMLLSETCEGQSYFTNEGLSVSMSWYRVPLWDLRPDIISCPNVAIRNLRSCFCGAPSLTRESVTLRLTAKGNRARVLWICSQEPWPLDHRGGPPCHLSSITTKLGSS
jgi:hypothetical protein